MEPGHLRFGGGFSSTVLHPLVAVAMLVAIASILALPRKYVIVPLLLGAFLVPVGQVLVVTGFHLTVLRILILFGLARVISLDGWRGVGTVAGRLNSVDKAFVLWAFFYALTFVLLYMETPALVNRLGFLVDTLGGYLLLRSLIRNEEDMRRVTKLFALISVVMAGCMINEQLTRQNIFWALGGGFRLDGTSMSLSDVRAGQVRSQGVFVVYILAGLFGATLLPLFGWLWKHGESRIVAIAGVISSVIIVLTSHSSTPLVACAAGVVGFCFWPLRGRMRIVCWIIVITLLGLQIAMKADVWWLIAHVDLTGASTSYDRAALIDNFVKHFGDWWLLGARQYNTWGFNMWDLCNQYVMCGQQGGLITLVLFIAIISRSFRRLGVARKLVAGERKNEWLLWLLGVALFVHVAGYFGAAYDSQMDIVWFVLLASISAATSEIGSRVAVLEGNFSARDLGAPALATKERWLALEETTASREGVQA